MSESNLVAIKRRIKSIKNTGKITKAMNLVANSKLKKINGQLISNERYYSKLKEVVLDLAIDDEFEESNYCTDKKCERKLYVVFTSDMGLCGSFNNNVIGKIIGEIGENASNAVLITIGEKGHKYFRGTNIETLAEFIEVSDTPGDNEAEMIVSKIKEVYDNSLVSEVYGVYTKYITSVTHETIIEKILPLPRGNESKNTLEAREFEPSKKELLTHIMDTYLKGTILNMLLNSKASEQGARLYAMDGASRSAKDLLDELQTKFNRVRQNVITEEISEIIGGAEAQK
ncbi:ATP synthase F1 subunit gamma [Clostridium sp. DL1XJH146]